MRIEGDAAERESGTVRRLRNIVGLMILSYELLLMEWRECEDDYLRGKKKMMPSDLLLILDNILGKSLT